MPKFNYYNLKHLAEALDATAEKANEIWKPGSSGMTVCIHTACDDLPEELKDLVALLLIACWNDALEWAREVKK